MSAVHSVQHRCHSAAFIPTINSTLEYSLTALEDIEILQQYFGTKHFCVTADLDIHKLGGMLFERFTVCCDVKEAVK